MFSFFKLFLNDLTYSHNFSSHMISDSTQSLVLWPEINIRIIMSISPACWASQHKCFIGKLKHVLISQFYLYTPFYENSPFLYSLSYWETNRQMTAKAKIRVLNLGISNCSKGQIDLLLLYLLTLPTLVPCFRCPLHLYVTQEYTLISLISNLYLFILTSWVKACKDSKPSCGLCLSG